MLGFRIAKGKDDVEMNPLPMLAVAAMLVPLVSWAQEPVVQTLTAECTTKGTSSMGERRSCVSSPQTIRTPENHVFIKDSLETRELSRSGTGPSCGERTEWGDLVEIIPHIKLPTSLTVSVHARSQGGMTNAGKRGWLKCSYSVSMTKYK